MEKKKKEKKRKKKKRRIFQCMLPDKLKFYKGKLRYSQAGDYRDF
jgi:hypothetical protein